VGNQISAQWPESSAPEAVGERIYSGNKITRAGRIRYEYDQAGRIILRQKSRISNKPDTWRYEWDAEDRLTAVTTPDGTRWQYQYDAFGRRIAKQRLSSYGELAEQIIFTWSGTTLVEQITIGSEQTQATTLTWDYDGLRPLTQIEHILQSEVDQRFYAIVTDLVGTPVELIDERGDIAWHADATLWGIPSSQTDASTSTPLRFPGQISDEETGWYYNLHRHYDPHTGRYTTPDPLGLIPAPNHYTYVGNPHTWTDPLGLTPYPAQLDDVSEAYVRRRHMPGGSEATSDKSTFNPDVDLDDLVDQANDVTPVGPNPQGNWERDVDAGRVIGNQSPDMGGLPTSRYRVVQDDYGGVITMHPL
jgi:RHS repeat-associated protein